MVRLEENKIEIVCDSGLRFMCMIVTGLKGEQHKVFTFNTSKREPLHVSQRAGNTVLEFNMNSQVRHFDQIFICQTESNGAVSAKQAIVDESKGPQLPPINFTRA